MLGKAQKEIRKNKSGWRVQKCEGATFFPRTNLLVYNVEICLVFHSYVFIQNFKNAYGNSIPHRENLLLEPIFPL